MQEQEDIISKKIDIMIYNFQNSKNSKIKIKINEDNILLKGKKETKILFKDLLGCKIYESKNILKRAKLEIIFSEIYKEKYNKFGIKNLKGRKFITIDLFHDEVIKLEKFKEVLMEKFYLKKNFKKKYNEKEKIYFYKKALIIVNPNSGSGISEKLFLKSKKILKANMIYYKKIETKKDKFIQKFIKNLKKEELLSFDFIISISGDGTIHEILNGFYNRKDINFKKEKLYISNLPGGSACCLAEFLSKTSENFLNLENGLYGICQFFKEDYESENSKKDKIKNNLNENAQEKKINKNIRPVGIQLNEILLSDGSIKKIFSFLGFVYGFFANVDIESEKFRFMGHYRFEFYAFLRYIYLNSYEISIYYPNSENLNLKLPPITEKIEEKEKIIFFKSEIYNFYNWGIPYFGRNHLSSPLLINNLGNFNLQIFNKKKGKMNFFRYFINHDKHGKNNLCVINELVKTFRIYFHSKNKKKTISIDGENYKNLDIQAIQANYLDLNFYLII